MENVKLLNEVLGTKAISCRPDGHMIRYDEHFVINVDTFAFKCLDWLYEEGYDDVSVYVSDWLGVEKKRTVCRLKQNEGYSQILDEFFKGESLQDAIFNACEWAIEEKEKATLKTCTS